MPRKKLTRTRDLRDARTLWSGSPRISVRSRSRPPARRYDVIIVGAGISGALAAHALVRDGCSVLVLDRRVPVTGSTMASTAMIQHEIDVPLHQLRQAIGTQAADRAWQRSAGAVLKLEEIVRTLRLSCGFERKKALFIAGDALDEDGLEKEWAARKAAGLQAGFLDRRQLFETYGLKRAGALVSDISASANPAQLAAGLLREAARSGADIVSGLEVTDLESIGGNVVLGTAEGGLLICAHAVFCTGYEFLRPLASERHSIISTWALASRPGLDLPEWLDDHMLWEASDPYLYLRRHRSGRLIAGGEDERNPLAYQSDEKRAAKTRRIRQKLKRLIGVDIGEPDFAWSAAFGTTDTGLPLIGAVPGMANVHAVMGFGGNGITFSQIAAEMVAAAVNGSKDPDADLFSLG